MKWTLRWVRGLLAGSVLCAACTACSAMNPATGNGDAPDTDDEPTEASCGDWQEAYCTWMNDCGALRFAECMERVEHVECKSSAPLERCVDELTSGDCTPARGCDAEDVADTTAARAECVAFQQEYCKYLLSCQPSIYVSLSACVAVFDEQLPCSKAYATSDGYEACIATLENPACDGYPPPVCENVIFTQ